MGFKLCAQLHLQSDIEGLLRCNGEQHLVHRTFDYWWCTNQKELSLVLRSQGDSARWEVRKNLFTCKLNKA